MDGIDRIGISSMQNINEINNIQKKAINETFKKKLEEIQQEKVREHFRVL